MAHAWKYWLSVMFSRRESMAVQGGLVQSVPGCSSWPLPMMEESSWDLSLYASEPMGTRHHTYALTQLSARWPLPESARKSCWPSQWLVTTGHDPVKRWSFGRTEGPFSSDRHARPVKNGSERLEKEWCQHKTVVNQQTKLYLISKFQWKNQWYRKQYPY